jgi:2-oxoglutarate ferredoxin oxidoreductase subunit gamma
MLGALLGLSDVVRSESVMGVLKDRVPPDFLELNRQALDLGLQLTKNPA